MVLSSLSRGDELVLISPVLASTVNFPSDPVIMAKNDNHMVFSITTYFDHNNSFSSVIVNYDKYLHVHLSVSNFNKFYRRNSNFRSLLFIFFFLRFFQHNQGVRYVVKNAKKEIVTINRDAFQSVYS